MFKKILAIGSSFVAGVVISTCFKLHADANSIRVVLIFNDQPDDKDLHEEFLKIFNKNRKAFKGLSINASSTYSYRPNVIEYRFRISDKDIHLVEKFIAVRD